MWPPAPADAVEAPIRVDVPDYPGALATSHLGSLLASPPSGVPWRPEPIPAIDVFSAPGDYEAWEAIDALGAQAWHDAGYDGAGVKIAVFDLEWFGADLRDAELGEYTTHDCYTHRSCEQPMDTARPRFPFEVGSHGVACAEVIRDLAPGAELHLVRVNGLTTLENAVAWAVREEIDLISMSLSFFNESFYDGTGAINDQMAPLAEAGILMVKSAGNYAEQHYSDALRDEDGDGLHEFASGGPFLPIYLSSGRTQINVLWDQFATCGLTDLDAYVLDAEGLLVGRSTSRQDRDDEGCFSGERLSAYADETGWYYLQIRHFAGPKTGTRLDIMTRGGEIYGATPGGSVTDPNGPTVFVVGAVRADRYLTNAIEDFSSQGPTNAGLYKPDVAGPDGLTTSVYGTSGFFGTSASTPAVVGALALVMSRYPGVTPFEAGDKLRSWARPDAAERGATWAAFDGAMGAGRARLPPPEPEGCGAHWMGGLLLAPLALRRRR